MKKTKEKINSTLNKVVATAKNQYYSKLFTIITSVKFHIMAIATVLLYIGKINEGTWQETVLITAGFRSFEKVTSLIKKRKQAKEEVKK